MNNHMRGKDHIIRQMQLQEQRTGRGGSMAGGPCEMAKLSNSDRGELIQLRNQIKILQDNLQDYQI